MQCKDCCYNAHKKCSEKVPRDCTGEIPDDLLLEKQGDSTEYDGHSNGDDSDEDKTASAASAAASVVAITGGDENVVTPATFDPEVK